MDEITILRARERKTTKEEVNPIWFIDMGLSSIVKYLDRKIGFEMENGRIKSSAVFSSVPIKDKITSLPQRGACRYAV